VHSAKNGEGLDKFRASANSGPEYECVVSHKQQQQRLRTKQCTSKSKINRIKKHASNHDNHDGDYLKQNDPNSMNRNFNFKDNGKAATNGTAGMAILFMMPCRQQPRLCQKLSPQTSALGLQGKAQTKHCNSCDR
jgi:hypothetical protein